MRTRHLQRNNTRRSRCANNAGRRRGFTLIEAAMATVIVGVGVLALVEAQGGLHMKNRWSTHASTAMRLGNEIREMTLNLPRHDPVTDDAYWGTEPSESFLGDFDDVDDFDGEGGGLIFSADADNGPINASREIIPNMAGWSQTITVRKVDPFDIRLDIEEDDDPYVVLVEVVGAYQGPDDAEAVDITTVSWLAPNQ